MKAIYARLWAYVRPYGWAIAVSLGLVAVVGILEAASPILIGLIFDTLLGASSSRVITIPLIV
jgi:ABC-type multidrug transport system fused ATPase/permease subunit